MLLAKLLSFRPHYLPLVYIFTISILISTCIPLQGGTMDNDQYYKVTFHVVQENRTKPFKYTDSKEVLQSKGLKSGSKYQWLIHDWCADGMQLKDLAKILQKRNPMDNLILVDWTLAGEQKEEDYGKLRVVLEHVANVILFAIFRLHQIYFTSAKSAPVIDNSHLIGFGQGGLIAGYAGWLGNHKWEQINEPGGHLKDYKIENFLMDRITVIDPINFCSTGLSPICNQNVLNQPGYKNLLVSRDSAKFVDGIYTTPQGLETVCPLNNTVGLPHHRGIIINEGATSQPGCPPFEYVAGKVCQDMRSHCDHSRALDIYTEGIRLLDSKPKTTCHSLLTSMLGDQDPNLAEGTLSMNYHFEVDYENPFGPNMGCDEDRVPTFPKYETNHPKCAQQGFRFNEKSAWNWQNSK